jgi:hypothetical protein
MVCCSISYVCSRLETIKREMENQLELSREKLTKSTMKYSLSTMKIN